MSGKAVLERFIEKNPLAVMTRCIVGILMGDELDGVFERNRTRQYDETIRFSTVASSMAEIALGTVPNRNQAFLKYQEELQASRVAYYGKLNRTEPGISEAVVRYSARKAGELLRSLDFEPWLVLKGYRCFSIDGNHLGGTQKRLKETRGLRAATLPGTIVARFDHQTGLFDRAWLLEDGHAQEASVLDRVLAEIANNDLLIADRHFCIQHFLINIDRRCSCFVVRQTRSLKGVSLGKRRRAGKIDAGNVFEQSLVIQDRRRPSALDGSPKDAGTCQPGDTLVVRRITVELFKPTRDGSSEIHLLSNVPEADASACELADLYRQRWEIENAFHVLTMTLNCEMNSNCYPRCALFQFCMAMFAFNCRQVLLAALYAEHAREDVDRMSQYQVSLDTVSPMEGMLTAIDENEWTALTPQSVPDTASFLRRVSRHVNVRHYRASIRGPKRPPPKRRKCKNGTHVSTQKLLNARKPTC